MNSLNTEKKDSQANDIPQKVHADSHKEKYK